MIKLLFGIVVMIMVICGMAGATSIKSAGSLYIENTKGINDGTAWGIPVLEWNLQQRPFLMDIEFRNTFTSPRGYLGIPNHHSSQLEVHLGQKWKNYWATFSLGGVVYYDGNSDNIPAGVRGFNTVRIGIDF